MEKNRWLWNGKEMEKNRIDKRRHTAHYFLLHHISALQKSRVHISCIFLKSKFSWENKASYVRVMAPHISKYPSLTLKKPKNYDKVQNVM